jgi:uncharacterized protein (TIGR02001 family)
VLKGAMLGTTWFDDPHRATRDVDQSGIGDPAQVDRMSRARAHQRRAVKNCARLLFLTALCAPGSSEAEGWTGAIGANSEQVVRGVSETAGSAALVGSVQYYSVDGWFASVVGYASGARNHPATDSEATLEAGYTFPFGPLSSRLSFARHFDLSRTGERLNNDEATLTVAAQDRLFASVSALSRPTHLSSTFATRTGGVLAYDLLANVPLKGALSINVGIGYQDLHRVGSPGYSYGNAGIAGQWMHMQFQLSYIATNAKAKRLFGDAASNRWTSGIEWDF